MHKLQSEYGVIGEHSPNLDVSANTLERLRETFKIKFGTITGDDAFIFATSTVLGKKVGEPDNAPPFAIVQSGVRGKEAIIYEVFCGLFRGHEFLLPIVHAALLDVLKEMESKKKKGGKNEK